MPAVPIDVARDASDNRVLEAALEAQVNFIVSVDRDLLDLASFESIRIITEAEFIAILRTERL